MQVDFNQLEGKQRKILRLALIEAFGSSAELDLFLLDNNFEPLENYSGGGNFTHQVSHLIRELSKVGSLDQLMAAVLKEMSDYPALEGLEARLLTATSTPTDDALQEIWMVPHRRNPYFMAREDALSALHKALHGDGCAVVGQTQAISGLGGIGKTQTAVEYAYRHRDEYEKVLWVRGATEGDLAAGFGEVAQALDLAAEDAKQRLAAVHGWMRENRSWLLVIDNADNPDLLEPYLPTTCGGHILLTSRASYFGNLSIPRPLRLETLSPEDARAFLLKRVGRDSLDVEEEAAGALGEELGFLPLALEQASAYIAAKQTRFEDYLAAYRERRGGLLGRSKPETGEYPDGVATTWALNFDEVERASRTSADVLRFSAFLSPDQIPEELVESALTQFSFFRRLAEQLRRFSLWDKKAESPLAVDELLEPLIRYSLVERDLDNRSFSVHRLVQEVIKDDLDEASRRRWQQRVVRSLDKIFPKVEFRTWGQCARLLPHVLAFRFGAMRSFEFFESGRVFGEAASYLHAQGRYEEAEPLYERDLAIKEKALGAEHPELATTLNNLANLYRAQGRYNEAEPLYERSLAITEKALGSEHPEMATTLNNLALLYRDQGRDVEAEPLYERSLAIKQKALGGEHPEMATTLNNLASLHRTQGRYEEAEPLYERSLAIKQKALGGEHPEMAVMLNNLANLYRDQGRDMEAEPLYKRSLAIKQKALGGEHPEMATTLNNLASFYRDQGRYEEAEPLYERSQEIIEKTLGRDHPYFAKSLNNLANLYRNQGRDDEADELTARAESTRKKK